MTKKPTKKVYHASIYLRLSKEDGDVTTGSKNESNSISNQKSLIMDFLKDKHDIQVVSIREDDGYSGVDFNRPSFQLMLEDVKKGIIDCIIVKDLSRFGRNYIEVGRYLEKLFPMLGVRFIAVNDNYDSLNVDTAHDIVMPFKNLINDSYCRDLSVKIRSHLAVKRKNGEFIGAFACYGYLKDPKNKNQLIIDTYAGPVVQDIFRMKINGFSQYKIAEVLNEQGILSPMAQRNEVNTEVEELQNKVRVIEAKRMMQKNNNARVDLLSELVHQYKDAKTLTKELERIFVEQVLVYDAEHIKIKWKFDDVFAALMGNE